VGFVVNELALGQDFILVFGYSLPVSFQKKLQYELINPSPTVDIPDLHN
jgi:hypothetical protein